MGDSEKTSENILTHIEKPNGEVIRVEVSDYEGRKFAQIRQWFTDDNGELKRTKKGVTFGASAIPAIIQGLQTAEGLLKEEAKEQVGG